MTTFLALNGVPFGGFDEMGLPIRSGLDPKMRMEDDPAGGGGDPKADPANTDPTGDGADPTKNSGGGANGGGDDIDSLPAWAQKALREARDDAAKNRTKAKETQTAAEKAAEEAKARDDQLKVIAKALGLAKDEPTVEDLQKQLEERGATDAEKDAKYRQVVIDRDMFRIAKKYDADDELTLAVLERRGALKDLDVEAKDFTEKLDALVKKAVEENPRLKVTQVATKGGSQFKGNESDGGSVTPRKGLAGAIAAQMNS